MSGPVQQSFPMTIERAWRSLMDTVGRKNQTDATNQQTAIRGILRVMRRT